MSVLYTIPIYLQERSWSDLLFHGFTTTVMVMVVPVFIDALVLLALKSRGRSRAHERLTSGRWLMVRLGCYAAMGLCVALSLGKQAPVRVAWVQLSPEGELEGATVLASTQGPRGGVTVLRRLEAPGRLVDALPVSVHDPAAWSPQGRFAWFVPVDRLDPDAPPAPQLIEVATLRRLASAQEVLRAAGASRDEALRLHDRFSPELGLEFADGRVVRVSAQDVLGEEAALALAPAGCEVGVLRSPLEGKKRHNDSRFPFNAFAPPWVEPTPDCPAAMEPGALQVVAYDDKKFGDGITRLLALVEGEQIHWSAPVERIFDERAQPFGVLRRPQGVMIFASSAGTTGSALHVALLPLTGPTPVKRWRWRM